MLKFNNQYNTKNCEKQYGRNDMCEETLYFLKPNVKNKNLFLNQV